MKEQLLAKYPYKTELHAHTQPASGCSEFYAEGLVERYRAIGVDTVVLTNHYTYDGNCQKTREQSVADYLSCYHDFVRAAEAAGIRAAFGMEIRFIGNCNDYLLYGISEEDVGRAYDMLDQDIDRFYAAFKTKDNLIFQAHPFRNGITLADPGSLDGVESFNMHPGHNSRVGIAAAYAREHGLLVCGGTDFHHAGHEGVCLMRTSRLMTSSADVADVLRRRDFILDIGGSLVFP